MSFVVGAVVAALREWAARAWRTAGAPLVALLAALLCAAAPALLPALQRAPLPPLLWLCLTSSSTRVV